MKKKKVVLITVAIILVIVAIVAAILLTKSDAFGMTGSQRKKPVATVGGTEKISANEFAVDFQNYYGNIDQYNTYALYYGYGTYHDVSTPEGVESLRREILDELIEERACVAIAKQKGITLTAEEKDEAAKAGKSAYDSLIEQYTNSYAQNGTPDPKGYAVSSVAQYFSDYGIGNKAEFVRRNTYTQEATKFRTKLSEKLKEESGITAEQAAELYPDWASYYEGYYSDGYVAQFDEYFIEGYQNYRYPFIPDGFAFLRVIALNDEARAQELVAEIGTDAEVFEKYCMSEENTDKLMPKIAADEGYAISATDSSFDPSVYEAVSAMNVGDIKLVSVTAEAEHEHAEGEEHSEDEEVKTVTTYYIIRRIEGTSGMVPFEKMKDGVTETVVENAKEEYAEKQIHEWIGTEGNVVIDEALYAMVKGN